SGSAPADESLEVDCRSAAETVLEFDQSLQDSERLAVLLAVESGQHPRVIVDRGDRRPQALPQRRMIRPPSEIVVAVCAGGLGHDLQFAGVGLELEDAAADQIPLQERRLPVGPLRMELLQGETEAAQVLLPR